MVLNLFLVQEFLDKINTTTYDPLEKQSPIEEQLSAQGITYDLPEGDLKESYVSAPRYQLTEEDITALEGFSDQQLIGLTSSQNAVLSLDTVLEGEPSLFNMEIITSEFKKPLELDLENNLSGSIETIKSNIIKGDSYVFWNHYEDENVLLFFQRQNNKTVYFNDSAALIVLLNEEGNAIQYRQTMLDDLEDRPDEQTITDPINAIYSVWSNTVTGIPTDSHITLDLGYQTLVPLDDGVQVFVPTWDVIVNEQSHFFVNAMEGQYVQHDEMKFVTERKEALKREIQELKSE